MKIILLGDCHLGARQNSQVIAKHQIKLFDQLIDYCKENNIKDIIQLGDVYDQRKSINMMTLKMAYDLFDRFEEANINFNTLIGNHDVFYRDSIEITSSSLLLRNYKHIHVYDVPTTLTLGGRTFDLIPWICDENKDLCLNYIKDSKSDFCCGHFEINTFPIRYDTDFVGGLEATIFEKYTHVFSGHFHGMSEKDNITYVGTPYQLTWSDANNLNGFWVLDTDTLEYQQVLNPDRYFRYIHYDDVNKEKTTNLEGIDLKDTFIKLIVGNKTKPFLYDRFIKRIFNAHPTDVKIIDKELQVEGTETVDDNLINMNTIDIITGYIDNCNLSNKTDLKRIMVSLYNEAEKNSIRSLF